LSKIFGIGRAEANGLVFWLIEKLKGQTYIYEEISQNINDDFEYIKHSFRGVESERKY